MLLSLAINILAASAEAPPAHADLKIIVDHIVVHRGYLMIGVFPNPSAYDREACLPCIRVPVTGDRVEVTAADLPTGDYGIKLYQDVNGNQRLDKTLLGIPTEPYAFSNNAQAHLAPPPWGQARFPLSNAGASQTIHLPAR